MDGERDDNAGGEDAERKKEEASSRLIRACKQEGGDVEAAKQAIDDGANLNTFERGWFPLSSMLLIQSTGTTWRLCRC